MDMRIFAALTLVLGIGNGVYAEQDQSTARVGDYIILELTDDLAREYAQRSEAFRGGVVPKDCHIAIVATVARQLNDGQLQIEHTSNLNRKGEKPRLVTLTTTVDPSRITTFITPKNTLVCASPHAEATLTTEATKTLRLQLSDLNGLKLRTWTLAEEIGD